jgi:hypothetical protein
MKKILLFLVSGIVLISCTPKENEMRLTGFVKGMKEGTLTSKNGKRYIQDG